MAATEQELREAAGRIGAQMADTLAGKVTDAVDGFPAMTDEQAPAILRLIAGQLEEHAAGMET